MLPKHVQKLKESAEMIFWIGFVIAFIWLIFWVRSFAL